MGKMVQIGRLKSLGGAAAGGFTEADKEILVKVVKHAQWHGITGTKGHWKKYLSTIDKSTNRSHDHDPSRRPWNILASFIETWKDEKDLEIVKRVREYIKYNRTADTLETTEPWPDCQEEKLVRMTREHPLYARDYNFHSFHEGWLRTELEKPEISSTPPRVLALDCEMVNCEDGSMQVVRVCVVDRNLQTVIDTLVQPSKKVTEYKSDITGVTHEDLKSVTVTQTEIQEQVIGSLSPGTIIVGHSLHNDLKALKIDHRRVIDTGYIFPIQNRPHVWSPPLRDLCKLVLGYDFRDDSKPHDCLEDAKIPMRLILHCIDQGPTPLIIPEEVDEAALSKLLIHKVPYNVKIEDLKSIFPATTPFQFQDVERDTVKRAPKAKYYSTFAVFDSKEIANRAFEQLKGAVGEDITGRLQKAVPVRSRFKYKNAVRTDVVVRKMDINKIYSEAVNVSRIPSGLDVAVKTSGSTDTTEVEQSNKVVDAGPSSVPAKGSSLKRSRIESIDKASVVPEAKSPKKSKRTELTVINDSISLGETETEAIAIVYPPRCSSEKTASVVDVNAYEVLSVMDEEVTRAFVAVPQLDSTGIHKTSKRKKKKSKSNK